MSEKDTNGSDEKFNTRRDVLKWASSVGLLSVSPEAVAAVAEAKENQNNTKSTHRPPTADVNISHVTERPAIRGRIEKFKQTGDPRIFYNRALRDVLKANPKSKTFDLNVTTVGEPNKIKSVRYGRAIHGWSLSDREISDLKRFGKLGYIPDVISTSVSLYDVSRKNLVQLAKLDTVVDITLIGEPQINVKCGCDGGQISASKLRSSEHFSFNSVTSEYTIPSTMRIGIIDTGYDASVNTYSSSHAADVGIDTNLANDFTSDSDWRIDSYNGHGTAVADTLAYFLGTSKGHDDLYVPLKVWENTSEDSIDPTRQAMDYALQNDIDVITNTINFYADGGKTHFDYCPSLLCSEHDAYTNAGYLPVTAAGNYRNDSGPGKVVTPGVSRLTIGVGGIDDTSCSNADRHCDAESQYAPTVDYSSCPYCCSLCSGDVGPTTGSCPTIYGSYHTQTDTGCCLDGTSFAVPQVAAAAAIMQSNSLYNYAEGRTIFQNMNSLSICPNEAAETGQLLDASAAYYNSL